MAANLAAWAALGMPACVTVAFLAIAISALTNYLMATRIFHVFQGASTAGGFADCFRKWRSVQRSIRLRSRQLAARRTRRAVSTILLAICFGTYAGLGITLVLVITISLLRSINRQPDPSLVWQSNLLPIGLALFSMIKAIHYGLTFTPHMASRLPRLSIERNKFGLRRSREAALDVFRYHQLRTAAVASWFVGVLVFTIGSATNTATTETDSTSREISAFMGMTLSAAVVYAIRRSLRSILLRPRLIIALSSCIDAGQESDSQDQRYSGVPAPFGVKRAKISTVAELLRAIGRRIDRTAPLHPSSSMMHAAAARLKRHIASPASLTQDPSAPTADVIRGAMEVVIGPRCRHDYTRLANELDAFGSDDLPRPDLRLEHVGRWSAFLDRIAHFFDTYARIAAAIWGFFTFALIIYLVATGKLELSSIQMQK